MAGCHFGQMQVGVEADLFEVRDPCGRQRVIQVLGDQIRIDIDTRPGYCRGGQPTTANHVLDPLHQLLSFGGLFDFFAQGLGFTRFEEIVHIGQ